MLYTSLILLNKDHGGDFLLVLAIISTPFWIVGIAMWHTRRKERLYSAWRMGLSPNLIPFKESKLLEAYIALSVHVIRNDHEEFREKVTFLQTYFEKHFHEHDADFFVSFKYLLHEPIPIPKLTRWLRIQVPAAANRIQILYFLCGIATVDGSINSREMKTVREVGSLLGLSPKDINSTIEMFVQREWRKRQKPEEPSSEKRRRDSAFKILGVSPAASIQEIKKAYRALVKKHHPDRFYNASESDRKLARERFIEIKKAYELLSN